MSDWRQQAIVAGLLPCESLSALGLNTVVARASRALRASGGAGTEEKVGGGQLRLDQPLLGCVLLAGRE
jgi:hypothetical protein